MGVSSGGMFYGRRAKHRPCKHLPAKSSSCGTRAAEKLIELGAEVVTLSDSDGFLEFEAGLDAEALKEIMELKLIRRRRLSEFEGRRTSYRADRRPWSVSCDVAMPCATTNSMRPMLARWSATA